MGLDIFRNLARNQRPAIAKDLNTIFDKYDKTKENESVVLAKTVSPSNRPPPTPSRKRSVSRGGKSQKSELESKSQFNTKIDTQKNLRSARPSFKTVSQEKNP